MATLTVRITEGMEQQLNLLAEKRGMSRSDIVRDILQRQLAVEAFREIRRELMPYAAAAGYLTDEDVFRDIS
ncbi:MAG TPA: CopG family transcriptional regulator [Thermoanaerobaculia bacterium]|jgi:predicted transcriptional regulator|nr:CopG family transcriptional regulator [Thermoanaerobaculia bacterium]